MFVKPQGKLRELLEKHGHTHLLKGFDIDIDEGHVEASRRHHKEVGEEDHWDYAVYGEALKRYPRPPQTSETVETVTTFNDARLLFWLRLIAVLLVLLGASHFVHAEGGSAPPAPKGVIIQGSNNGTVLITRPGGIFTINCSTNTACSTSGNTFNITASSTAATAWSAITAAPNSNAGTFSMSGNTLDLTATTLTKLRAAGGLTTSVNGDIGQDTTTGFWHLWQNGHDRLVAAATNVGSVGQVFLSNADGTGTFADPVISYNNPSETTAAWTSTTANNTALTVTLPVGTGVLSSVVVTLNQGSTITAGAVTFNVSDTTGFTNSYPTACRQVNSGGLVNSYTLQASTNVAFICNVASFEAFQVKLSPAIIGTGTVNVGIQPSSAPTQDGLAITNTVPVSGTFWQATQPVSGTVTVQQSTASNLKVDLSGTAANATAIKVDGSGVTQPVSGTVTANQGGTWTVQPGNTANTTPWLVTINQGGNLATVNASGQLTVNCAAGCSSAGDTVGASGTLGALNNAVSVALAGEQSVSFVLPSANNLVGTLTPEVSFDNGTTWVPSYIRQDGLNLWATTAAVSSTQASYHIFIPGGARNARVRVSAYTSGSATSVSVIAVSNPETQMLWHGIAGSTAPPEFTQVGGSDGANGRIIKTDSSGVVQTHESGTAAVSGTVTATQAIGTNLHIVCDSGCSSSTAPADEAAFTEGTTSFSPVGGYFQTSPTSLTTAHMGAVGMTATRHLFVNIPDALPTGSNVIGKVGIDQTTPGTTNGVQVNAALPAGTNIIGKVTTDQTTHGTTDLVAADNTKINGNAITTTDNGTQGVAPQATASSTGAALECNLATAATTNSTSCKGSAGNLYGFEVYNTTTTTYYLRLYNSAAAPTCSSATGFIRPIPIPAAAAAGQTGGVVSNFTMPVNYSSGIGFCVTGGSGSTDNTAAAVGLFVTLKYK